MAIFNASEEVIFYPRLSALWGGELLVCKEASSIHSNASVQKEHKRPCCYAQRAILDRDPRHL